MNFSTLDTIDWAINMMTFTLKEYASEIGQVRAGERLGVTQIAISKAVRSGRNIVVHVADDGKVSAFESKPFPAKKNNLKPGAARHINSGPEV
ncbi:Cro/CI family transcriptional regulator [Citrobacter farmeri]